MVLFFAFILDAIMGDPAWLPHPVMQIGRLISFWEKRLRKEDSTQTRKLCSGALLVALVLSGVVLAAWAAVRISFYLHPYFGYFVTIILLSTTLAARCLHEAAEAIRRPLLAGNLPEARHAVSMVVSRRTTSMSETEIARAAVETVAENTVDGVTAPLFYALLGGLPAALGYKAINTMDSMLGYKNEKYLFFGRAAARLDDAANWLPARLTVPVMLVAAALLRLDVRSALAAAARDARRHPSPNSGWAEATAAGALNIRLGGENQYDGYVSKRPLLHAAGRPAAAGDIRRAVLLMRVTSAFFLLFGLAVRALLFYLWGKAGL